MRPLHNYLFLRILVKVWGVGCSERRGLSMSFLIWEACPRLQEHALVRFCELISWEGLRSSMGDLGRSGYGP